MYMYIVITVILQSNLDYPDFGANQSPGQSTNIGHDINVHMRSRVWCM